MARRNRVRELVTQYHQLSPQEQEAFVRELGAENTFMQHVYRNTIAGGTYTFLLDEWSKELEKRESRDRRPAPRIINRNIEIIKDRDRGLKLARLVVRYELTERAIKRILHDRDTWRRHKYVLDFERLPKSGMGCADATAKQK